MKRRLTLEIADRGAVNRRTLAAFKGRQQRARISFATPELLFKLLKTKRWELIRAMAGAGSMSIREAARRVNRDVKAVHGDIQSLLGGAILRKTEDGRVEFPFDAIHVDVVLHAA